MVNRNLLKLLFLLIVTTSGCNAQGIQIETEKDSFPKGRIEVKPPATSEYNYLFVFYNKNGKIIKEITDKNLPTYSKFKSLDFPKVSEEREGVIKYDLRDLTFIRRKEVLQKAGLIQVPDTVIRKATEITYFGNEVQFKEGDRYIIAKEASRIFDNAPKGDTYTCWEQTHISIFDNT